MSWRPSDPGRFALRLAVRTGVVVPIAMALGLATGNEQTALFASFGAFSMLLFVDFGGPRPVRLGAYVTLGVAGSLLIVIGTLCSQHALAASLAMLVVGFTVLFSGVVNGYLAAAASAVLLAFILPAMVPARARATSSRGSRAGGSPSRSRSRPPSCSFPRARATACARPSPPRPGRSPRTCASQRRSAGARSTPGSTSSTTASRRRRSGRPGRRGRPARSRR